MGSFDSYSVAADILKLRKKLTNYDATSIFNVDRTGLFYQPLPRHIYIHGYEDLKSVRDTKAMKSKNRTVGYVFIRAISLEIPICARVISKPQNPRCFRMKNFLFDTSLRRMLGKI